jgi:ATP-dependent DNA ligase
MTAPPRAGLSFFVDSLPLKPPYPPMEALSVERIPRGDNWQYEPKWDGFRCLAFRDGDSIYLQSKSGRPLARFFPDIVQRLAGVPAHRFVLDGELLVPTKDGPSFEQLQLRLHPAASRGPRKRTRAELRI